MNRKEIIEYLLSELASLKSELNTMQADYNAADHMGRVGKCISLDKAQDKYYHFWMVCNDLGIISV